jgi:hypothetical protein
MALRYGPRERYDLETISGFVPSTPQSVFESPKVTTLTMGVVPAIVLTHT